MHVFRSMILDARIDRVWAAVRAFDGVANWNPGVDTATLENGVATATGTIRSLQITDGTVFRETLLAHWAAFAGTGVDGTDANARKLFLFSGFGLILPG